jgi:hypothetical protein
VETRRTHLLLVLPHKELHNLLQLQHHIFTHFLEAVTEASRIAVTEEEMEETVVAVASVKFQRITTGARYIL